MKKIITLGSLLLAAASISAYEQEWSNGLKLSTEHRLTAGVLMRVESRDPDLIGIANGGTARSTNNDDGNLNFERSKVAATAFKFTSDVTLARGDIGLFTRTNALLDLTLKNHRYFNEAEYGPGRDAPLTEYEAKNRTLQDHNGNNVDLLDAFLFTQFDLAGRPLALRLGRQVVNWGESTLIQNGINSTLTADANRLRVPGFDPNEVIIPYEQVWFSVPLWGGVNLESFYQLKWRKTEPDAAGSYFSAQDFVGLAATRANIGFGAAPENTPGTSLPRAADNEAKSEGQFGFKLDNTFEGFNGLNLAFYAMQYHSRLPVLSGTSKPSFGAPSTTANYFIEYPEDIKLYGLSFNTTLPFGGIAVQGEYSYKQDQPLQIDDVELLLTGLGVPSQLSPVLGASLGGKYLRGWRRHDVQQVDVAFTKILNPSEWFGYDQLTALLEVASMQADLPPTSTLRYEAPATYTPGDCTLSAAACTGGVTQNRNSYATPSSWGYRLLARAEYNAVGGSAISLLPTLLFAHDVNGTSPAPLTNFVEDRTQVAVSLGLRYLDWFNADLAYVRFDGAGARNLLGDRDYVDLSFKVLF